MWRSVPCLVFVWIYTASQLGSCVDNLALHKPASMSPHPDGEALDARRAVDGKHSSAESNDVCVHSVPGDPNPWVVVDLLKEHYITSIFVVNRLDCCQNRLHDIIIDVFKTNPTRCSSANGSICKSYIDIFDTERTVDCNMPVSGRFVRIWKPIVYDDNDVLNFCEIEVYGEPKEADAECSPKHTKSVFGKRLVSNNVTLLSVTSWMACMIECEMIGACVGGNYNIENGVCELHTRPEYNAAASTDPHWVYFGNDLC